MTSINKTILATLFLLSSLVPCYSQQSISELKQIVEELFEQDKYEEVILNANKILELDPESVYAYMFGGIAYKKANNFPKTIEYFAKAAEISPGRATLNNLAGIYAELGFAYIALVNFDKCFEYSPRNPNADMNKGLLMSDYQKYDEALLCIESAITGDPTNPLYYLGLGQIYGELGDEDKKESSYRKALEYNPDMPEINFYLTKKYESEQEPISAIEEYTKIIATLTKRIEYNRYDAESYLLRGHIYRKLKQDKSANDDYKQAEIILNKVLEDIPNSWRMMSYRGEAYLGQKEYDKARKDFEAALIFNPFHKDTIELLAEIDKMESE